MQFLRVSTEVQKDERLTLNVLSAEETSFAENYIPTTIESQAKSKMFVKKILYALVSQVNVQKAF